MGSNENCIYSNFTILIGATNSGKSTLFNKLIGEKISIVTHKSQTTQTLIHGSIFKKNNEEIIIVDSPGIYRKKKLHNISNILEKKYSSSTFLFVVDSYIGINLLIEDILERIRGFPAKKLLILNKIDKIKKHNLFAITDYLNKKFLFERTFMVSSKNGSGCKDLLNWILQNIKPGRFYDLKNKIPDFSYFRIEEITREKIYIRMNKEIPYISKVFLKNWKIGKDNSVFIEQVIYVNNENQKKILIGRNGNAIKFIGKSAREDISKMLMKNVHLFLIVKIQKFSNKKQ